MVDTNTNKQYICDTELISEWDWEKNSEFGLNPYNLTHGSTKYAYWICEKGHHYKARIDHRFIMKSGCPYCAGKLPIIGENDLASQYPELIKEWNYNKNDKEPKDYIYGSNKKVWWTCSKCGYEWQTAISHRTKRDTGCPICAKEQRVNTRNKKFIVQRGSLAENMPELCAEWDYQKNAPLIPDDVTIKSNKKVWWICQTCGFSYKKTVSSRSYGEGCPACAGKYVVEGHNDLQSQCPDIVKEWHPTLNGELKPNQVTAYNDRRIWWHCSKCNYDWEATIYSRTGLGTGCPECAKDRFTSFPEQTLFFYLSKVTQTINRYEIEGNEIDVFLPDLSVGIEYNSTYYHKDKREDDIKKVSFFSQRGIKIIRIEEGEKDAFFDNVIFYKYKDAYYKDFEPIIKYLLSKLSLPMVDINIERDSLEIYSSYLTDKGNESLAAKKPQIAKEWNYEKNKGLTPEQVSHGSNIKVWWKCSKCNYEWVAAISSRKKSNCPKCRKKDL